MIDTKILSELEAAKEFVPQLAPETQTQESITEELADFEAQLKAADEEKEQSEAQDSAEEDADAPDAPATEVQDSAEVEEEKSTDMDKARKALLRDGYSEEMLSRMTKRDVFAIGLARSKNQEDVDKVYADLHSLKAPKNEKVDAPATTPAIASADLSDWEKKVEEQLGPDVAPLLVEGFRRIVTPLQARLDALQQSEVTQRMDLARKELSGAFPEVLEPEKWTAVIKKAEQISGAYTDAGSCLRDACKLLDMKSTPAVKTAATTNKKNGLPTSSARKPSEAALTVEELEYKAMLAYERDDTQEGNRLAALSKRAAKK